VAEQREADVLVADDGSWCRVPGRTFARVRPGRWCNDPS
jgi:hypothetical protein